MSPEDKSGIKVVASNRRASFDYALEDRFEAGIALSGGEIKSVRAGRMDLRDAFVQVRSGEAWLINAYIPAYELSTGFARSEAQGTERRDRKLLLRKKQIGELARGTEQRGYTVIATRTYLKRGRAKVEIALAKGKKQYDKRQSTAKRDADREIRRALRER
jgi:SsrA-binding protein